MSVISRLASSLGRRDDVPNQELARELVEAKAVEEIGELVANLANPSRRVQSDCIKVLYEIGYLAPELIAEYVAEFLALLESKNNRLVWGGMIALSTIAELKADILYAYRDKIKRAIDTGSVITADRGIKTLAIVASQREEYVNDLFPYLLEHLATCRAKDLPQRAEYVLRAVNAENKRAFIEVIEKRMSDAGPSQIRRLKKILAAAESR